MYPITRESVIAPISSSVAEKAVCWCDGRKKRNRRILRRLTHLAVGGRVIGGAGIGEANLGFGDSAEEHLVGVIADYTNYPDPASFSKQFTQGGLFQNCLPVRIAQIEPGVNPKLKTRSA